MIEEAEAAMAASKRLKGLLLTDSDLVKPDRFRSMAKAIGQRVILFSPKGEMEIKQSLDMFQIICNNLKAPISSLTSLFLSRLDVKEIALVP